MKQLRRDIARYLSLGLAPYLLHFLIRLLHASMRIELVGREVMPSFTGRGEGFVGIFWHGRLLMIPFIYPGRALHTLVSTHRDGEIIARILERFGFRLVRGSSKKGGSAALKEMVRLLREDKDLAITPDGPKGPREVVKPGVAQVARLTGKAVIPIAFSASRAWRLGSWDRFLIPKPFSRGVYVVGEPLRCRDGEEPEAFRVRIEAALRDVTETADEYFGDQGPGTRDR